jgi:hypothetical protein
MNVPDIGNAIDTLTNQIGKDGDHTRSKISQSAETIINHLHMNESIQFSSNDFAMLPNTRIFEEMERPMLCFSVEEIEVVLGFVRIMVIKNGKLMTHVTVSISRYITFSLQSTNIIIFRLGCEVDIEHHFQRTDLAEWKTVDQEAEICAMLRILFVSGQIFCG